MVSRYYKILRHNYFSTRLVYTLKCTPGRHGIPKSLFDKAIVFIRFLTKMDLNKILSDTEDITDPACIERVIISLEDIFCEDEEFMQLLIYKADDMIVTWDQPWYQRSNCLSRRFKENDDENLEKYRTDPITKIESERMKKNWRKFIKMYDVPDKLLSFARWKNRNKCRSPNTPQEIVRRFVTAFLAKGLERNIHQVYKHIVTKFGSPVKGPYSADEEKLMEICFHHQPDDSVKNISLLLSRDPRGIYKRLQQKYNGKPEKKRLKWTLQLASKFLNLLLQYSRCSLEELKGKKFEKTVWLKLEKDMDQQYPYLQKFWYNVLHVQIFVKQDIKLNKTRLKVIDILKESPYQVWSDIQWNKLPQFFPDGFTHSFLYKIFTVFLRKNMAYLKQPLNDVLDYILHKVKNTKKNKRLKNLIYEQGELQIISYKKSKKKDKQVFDE